LGRSLWAGQTVAYGTALVEYDSPPAVRLATPDRIERPDSAAAGISDRSAAEGKRSGLENFDNLGTPGERGCGTFKEGVPACHHSCSATKSISAAKEDRVDSQVGRERLGITGRESFGKTALSFENLPSQSLPAARLGAGHGGGDEQCETQEVAQLNPPQVEASVEKDEKGRQRRRLTDRA